MTESSTKLFAPFCLLGVHFELGDMPVSAEGDVGAAQLSVHLTALLA